MAPNQPPSDKSRLAGMRVSFDCAREDLIKAMSHFRDSVVLRPIAPTCRYTESLWEGRCRRSIACCASRWDGAQLIHVAIDLEWVAHRAAEPHVRQKAFLPSGRHHAHGIDDALRQQLRMRGDGNVRCYAPVSRLFLPRILAPQYCRPVVALWN